MPEPAGQGRGRGGAEPSTAGGRGGKRTGVVCVCHPPGGGCGVASPRVLGAVSAGRFLLSSLSV